MDDLGDLVRRLSHDLRVLTRAAAEPQGLNPHELRALRTIAELDRARPSDLADRLRIAPRSATDVVDLLEDKALVERLPHPTDRRATLLSVTGAGVRVLAAVEGERARAQAAYFARLDTGERAQLTALLRALVEPDEIA